MIIRKQHIQEPVNPRKRAKENNLTDLETVVLNKRLQRFGVGYTTKVILMRKLVVLTVEQVKMMAV